MSIQNDGGTVSRRHFIETAALMGAIAVTPPLAKAAEQAAATASGPASRPGPLSTRPLGKSGAAVTMLTMGGSTELTPRLLDYAYSQGVRCFDTAAGYANGKSEQAIGEWLAQTGRRGDVVLITKNGTKQPKDLLTAVDSRLKSLRTEMIDVYFLHGLGGAGGVELAKSPETRRVAEQLKKSGKIRFFGFSTHSANVPDCLLAAAEGGFVDAIMMSYSPVTGKDRDEKFDRALDACHKAGIGLIAMKTMRGMSKSLATQRAAGLNAHQAAIQAVLSDDRIASVCSEMSNFAHVEQNTQAVREFRKMDQARIDRLRDVLLAGGLAYCPGCPACREGILGRHPHVQDILRYLSYHEQDGKRAVAREKYRALPAEAPEVSREDLAAARDACVFGVDYLGLLERARHLLA